MRVLRGIEANNFLQEAHDRSPKAIKLPEGFRDESLASGLETKMDYTLSSSVDMGHSRSAFWNRAMTVVAQPPEEPEGIHFTVKGVKQKAHPDNFGKSKNNIKMGEARLVEHHVVLRAVLGILCDWEITQNAFPILPGSSAEILKRLKPSLVTSDRPLTRLTMQEPCVFDFGEGRYYALSPPKTGNEDLIEIDHQIRREGIKDLGNQRLQVSLEPAVFAYMARARTLGYEGRTKLAQVITLCQQFPKNRYPWWGIGLDNAAFYAPEGCINPNFDFVFPDGTNLEAICHEAAIDKPAPLAFFPGRFVGKITSCLTNHHKEIDIVKTIMRDPKAYLEPA